MIEEELPATIDFVSRFGCDFVRRNSWPLPARS
jgi:hypothetical protein